MAAIPVNPDDVMSFPNQAKWRTWLAKNHAKSDGIFLRIYKKASQVPTVDYKQALDEALCYGWIDSVKKVYDDVSYLQRFSPRRKRSLWSQVNIAKVAELIKAKKMMEPGMKEIERAKADGRWDAAYHPASTARIPDDLQVVIDGNKKMKEFVATLSKANIYAITWRLATAKKPETREKRFKEIVKMLREGKKWH